MKEDDVRDVLRSKGFCGHISGETESRQACIKPVGHDRWEHESKLNHLIGRKLEFVTVSPLEPGDFSKCTMVMKFDRAEMLVTILGPCGRSITRKLVHVGGK